MWTRVRLLITDAVGSVWLGVGGGGYPGGGGRGGQEGIQGSRVVIITRPASGTVKRPILRGRHCHNKTCLLSPTRHMADLHIRGVDYVRFRVYVYVRSLIATRYVFTGAMPRYI